MSDEQARALELAETGASLHVFGYAATGKTSVLRAFAMSPRQRARRLLLLGESRDVGVFARLPDNVQIRSAYSLAYRALGFRYRDRIGPLTALGLADRLGLTTDVAGVTPRVLAMLVLSALKRFMRSDDMEINTRHSPYAELEPLSARDTYEALKVRILDLAGSAWAMMIDPASDCPVTHSAYLKAWQLSRPRIDADAILCDDAEDMAPVVGSILRRQSARVLWAGDPWQGIGDLRATPEIGGSGTVCPLTRSFRFGQAIAEVANAILASAEDRAIRLSGAAPVASAVRRIGIGPPDAAIYRTEAGVMRAVMAHLREGDRVAVLGGVAGLLARLRGAATLRAGRRTAAMPFALFAKWRDFEDYASGVRGGDWLAFLRLLRAHGVTDLIRALERMEDRRAGTPEVTVALAPRTKGHAWDRVRLGDDFIGPGGPRFAREGARLLYLAVTRARKVLDLSRCEAARDMLGPVLR